MKKKIVSLVLVAALAMTALVGTTLAYFTDTDNATNTFTMGNVKIEQYEWQRGEAEDGSGEIIEEFEQDQKIFPAVHSKLTPKEDVTVNDYNFTIRSQKGNYIDKIINVENTGNSDAYVRTLIAIPNMNGYDDNKDATENPFHWNYLDSTDFNGIGWNWSGSKEGDPSEQDDKISEVVIGGVEYDVYVATYNSPLPEDEFTSPSMVGFYLDDSVDYDDNGYFSMQNGKRIELSDWLVPNDDGYVTLNIYALSQACQTEGFDDAWEALDEAFGDVTKDNAEAWFAAILPQN